ncbi:hypothetical protein SAMN05660657_05483 [Geodermatophilus amargosae]|uniref:SnoaL-like domain-containing protein n=1 Tax=Geodermatophilus amargosae TaxID=1296565 RepID=A0A1I7D934_9ACTN|nr:hypothetical protein SAMN05660657_05483 [Geodermatophilus amargosae]
MIAAITRPEWAPATAAGAGNTDERLVLDLMSALSKRDAQGLRDFFSDDAMYQSREDHIGVPRRAATSLGGTRTKWTRACASAASSCPASTSWR